MSLVGKLEDLSVGDILQILSVSRRTGILTIETSEGKSTILFKNGLVLNSTSPSPTIHSLGQILVERGLVTRDQLQQLLELQKKRGNEPLGSILLEAEIIREDTLQEILKARIRETIVHLMTFQEGNFSFDLREVVPFNEIHFNPEEVPFAMGWSPQHLLRADADDTNKEKRKSRTLLFHPPPELTIRLPRMEETITYEQIKPAHKEPLSLEDLKLPEMGDFPAFELIAEQIDFPLASASLSLPAVLIQNEICPFTNVLLVEEEALVRQVLSRRLQERGFRPHLADNPAEAARILRRLTKKGEQLWIITDLVMPTSAGDGFLGGLELVEAARRINSAAPLFVITDYEDSRAQTRAFSLGVFHFHKKPILSGSSIQDAEAQLYRFTDTLIHALRQPPYRFEDPDTGEEFWGDLKWEAIRDSVPTSATNMLAQVGELHRIFERLKSPKEIPEISSLLLRYAAEFFDRGLLFVIRKDEVAGWNGFGETGDTESMPQKARRIRFTLSEDSIFRKVFKLKQTHSGRLTDTLANRQLISLTGRLIPPAVALLPILSDRNVFAMLYGDQAVTKRPIRNLEGLEIFLAHAGIAMENALQQRKMKSIRFR